MSYTISMNDLNETKENKMTGQWTKIIAKTQKGTVLQSESIRIEHKNERLLKMKAKWANHSKVKVTIDNSVNELSRAMILEGHIR